MDLQFVGSFDESGVAALEVAGTGDWEGALAVVDEAADGMIGSLELLADAGAVRFVVLNVAYGSESAATCGEVEVDLLAERFNEVLEAGLATLNDDLRLVYFDLAELARTASEQFITDCAQCVLFFDPSSPVCSNPDDLFYWDSVHFSAPVHALIGDAITVSILQDEVLHLWTTGVLSRGHSNALLAKLDGAYERLGARKPRTAANKVGAFANQVRALIRTDRLSAEQAELLIVGAQGIIDQH